MGEHETEPERPYIGTVTAASLLGVSETIVKRWAAKDKIKGAYREGKQWFLPRVEVERLADERREKPA